MCDNNDTLRMYSLQLPTTNQKDYNYNYIDVRILSKVCNCNDYMNVEC